MLLPTPATARSGESRLTLLTSHLPSCCRYTTKPWLKLLKAQVAELKGPVTTFKAQYVPDWNDTDSTDTKVAAVRLLCLEGCHCRCFLTDQPLQLALRCCTAFSE